MWLKSSSFSASQVVHCSHNKSSRVRGFCIKWYSHCSHNKSSRVRGFCIKWHSHWNAASLFNGLTMCFSRLSLLTQQILQSKRFLYQMVFSLLTQQILQSKRFLYQMALSLLTQQILQSKRFLYQMVLSLLTQQILQSKRSSMAKRHALSISSWLLIQGGQAMNIATSLLLQSPSSHACAWNCTWSSLYMASILGWWYDQRVCWPRCCSRL